LLTVGHIHALQLAQILCVALTGGSFTTVNRIPRNRLARLNADGSLDSSFDPGMGANNSVRAIWLQDDGKILIGGQFTRVNGITRSCVARLNADGSVDTSFNPGSGVGGAFFVNAIALQKDGQILVGGDFPSFNGSARGSIVRLNPDGNVDATFDSGNGSTLDNPIIAIALHTDNKVVIAGSFYTYRGTRRVNIARLNTDGSLDTSFDPGSAISGGLYNMIQCLVVQRDGKILVAGAFDKVNGVPRRNLVRLNPSGSLDPSFTAEVNNPVRSIVSQADGNSLIAGGFTAVNRLARSRLARLNDAPAFPATIKLINWQQRPGEFRCEVQGTPVSSLVVESSSDLTQWIPLCTNQLVNGCLEFRDAESTRPLQRFYRLRTVD
jgi:uncharacterized delta-60 repeat protein